MSLAKLIEKIERERALNNILLERLIEGLDADIAAITEKQAALREEFAERDASLLCLIDGDPPRAVTPIAGEVAA
jgi:hypothetical protein